MKTTLRFKTSHRKSHNSEINGIFVVDCKKKIWGRISNLTSLLLRNRFDHRYSFHRNTGNLVFFCNFDKIRFTGDKQKKFSQFVASKFIGNSKFVLLAEKRKEIQKFRMFVRTVKSNLPKNKTRPEHLRNFFLVKAEQQNDFFDWLHQKELTKKIARYSVPIFDASELSDFVQFFVFEKKICRVSPRMFSQLMRTRLFINASKI